MCGRRHGHAAGRDRRDWGPGRRARRPGSRYLLAVRRRTASSLSTSVDDNDQRPGGGGNRPGPLAPTSAVARRAAARAGDDHDQTEDEESCGPCCQHADWCSALREPAVRVRGVVTGIAWTVRLTRSIWVSRPAWLSRVSWLARVTRVPGVTRLTRVARITGVTRLSGVARLSGVTRVTRVARVTGVARPRRRPEDVGDGHLGLARGRRGREVHLGGGAVRRHRLLPLDRDLDLRPHGAVRPRLGDLARHPDGQVLVDGPEAATAVQLTGRPLRYVDRDGLTVNLPGAGELDLEGASGTGGTTRSPDLLGDLERGHVEDVRERDELGLRRAVL